MSYYQIIGFLFKSLIFIVPVYLILFKQKTFQVSAITMLLCLASTMCFDFKVLGAFSLMQILLVLISFSKKSVLKNKYISNINSLVIIYIVYVSLVTIIGYLFKADYKLIGSIVQNDLRPVVQIIQVVFTFLTFIICLTIDSENSKIILKYFYKALLIFAIIGICQSLIYSFTSFDILPMRKDFVSATQGLSAIGENGFLRATAGLGEPKQLSKFLTFGFAFILLSHDLVGYKKIKISHICIFLLAMFFSSSTTGYLMYMIVFIIYLIKRLRRNVLYILPVIIAITILIPFVLNTNVISHKFEMAKQHGEIPGLENSDTAAALWLINEPEYLMTGAGIGNTVAYAYEYAPFASKFINNYPYTLRRGLIKVIAESGIIALVLQTLIFTKIYKISKQNSNTKYLTLFIIIMYFFLTCEAIIEVQLVLLALIFNCSKNAKSIKTMAVASNENNSNKYSIQSRKYRQNSI